MAKPEKREQPLTVPGGGSEPEQGEVRVPSRIEFLVQISVELGRTVPELLECPVLRDDLQWVWEAFWQLSRSRPSGMAPGPIPFSEIVSYANWRRLPGVQQEELLYLVGRLDEEFLTLLEADHRASTKERERV